MSQESSVAILEVLSEKYTFVTITTVDSLDDLKLLVGRSPDLVFLGMKFIPEDDLTYSQHSAKIWISEYLDNYGIAYTGSTKVAHQKSIDKSLAKQSVSQAALKTSPHFVIRQTQLLSVLEIPEELEFPLFVKPSNRGGGMGIDSDSVVSNHTELRAKVRAIATELRSDSLIEKYLTGREFSVAVLKHALTERLVAMPIELITEPDSRGHRLLSGQVKSENSETVLLIDDPSLEEAVSNLAIDAFCALWGRDYGRIDIRLDENNIPYFLEANLIPSLIDGYGSFPKACYLNARIDYSTMILNIVELAMMRHSLVNEEDELKVYENYSFAS